MFPYIFLFVVTFISQVSLVEGNFACDIKQLKISYLLLVIFSFKAAQHDLHHGDCCNEKMVSLHVNQFKVFVSYLHNKNINNTIWLIEF